MDYKIYRASEVDWWCGRCGARREDATEWNLSDAGRGIITDSIASTMIPENCASCGGFGIKWYLVGPFLLESLENDA